MNMIKRREDVLMSFLFRNYPEHSGAPSLFFIVTYF